MRWVVPHSLGGGYDTYSRLFAPYFERALGAEVVVENVRGAGGIVGARTIMNAPPDGNTLGILNASGLLVAAHIGQRGAPDPATSFSVLGRIASTRQVWATSASSRFRSLSDVVAAGRAVFGARGVSGTGFVNVAVASDLLGLKADVVLGYEGAPERVLAAVRGEVDLVALNFDSILSWIESGELRPLLQVADAPISDHPALDGVPLLGSETGWAVKRAAQLDRSVADARADASALAALFAAGRMVVAPKQLPVSVEACLRDAVSAALADVDFQAAAGVAKRSLAPANWAEAQAEIRLAAARVPRFAAVVKQAIERTRR